MRLLALLSLIALCLIGCGEKATSDSNLHDSDPAPSTEKSDPKEKQGKVSLPAKTDRDPSQENTSTNATAKEVGKTPNEKELTPKERLATNQRLTKALSLLPATKRVTRPSRGFWKDKGFSTMHKDGIPAVRVQYASKGSASVEESAQSGFGVANEDQSTTLVVIDAGKDAEALEEELSDKMRELGYSEAPLSFTYWYATGKKDEKVEDYPQVTDTIASWKLQKGAIYLGREGNFVLYAVESDSGSISSTSFGAQRIFLFKEASKKR